MLRRIQVENFQSLRDVTIEPGNLTVILGESDLGKSALFRAVNAAVTNQTGTEFIRYDSKEAHVVIETDEDEVHWFKGASARYEIYERDEKSGQFLFRPVAHDKVRGVDPDVAARLRMGSVECGDVSLVPSFHAQFNSPFLVADTAATRAKVIGELSGINLLFIATQEARRLEQQAKSKIKQRQDDLEKQQTLLVKYEHLPAQARKLDDALTAYRDAEEAEAQFQHISRLIVELQQCAARIQLAKQRASLLRSGLERFDALAVPGDAAAQLAGLVRQIDQQRARALAARARKDAAVAEVARLDEEIGAVTVCPACGQVVNE